MAKIHADGTVSDATAPEPSTNPGPQAVDELAVSTDEPPTPKQAPKRSK